ncbi:MAG TPA: sigma-54 dependent transcriptional regulator [Gemmatimonadales bacterium]|nr:sigma-54 dependent transcriptional regulator [Gemmatimonadales bacterium]
MPDRILITTDDLEHAVRINAGVEAAGFHTTLAHTLDEARQALRRDPPPDCVVVTGGLHESGAAQLLTLARDRSVSTLGLVEETEPDAKGLARRLGLTGYLEKPADPAEVAATVRRLIERRKLQQRTGIIGESPAIQEVLVKIEQMAPVTSTVLIEGESGTGKELVARAIHDLSPRRAKPFIAVSCAAIPETLLESELFGHEKGAFTGAAERRLGRFELADGGTIFLDEIGEMAAATQVKLLRVLEDRTFFRVGGTQAIKVDVRVVAATNKSLKEEVALGRFRDDLFYRLNVLYIYLPPLRERKTDIPLLVRRFTPEFARQHDRPFRGITPEALQILVDAEWPGNIRQLRNLIESMVVLAPEGEIRASDIPKDIREHGSMLPIRLLGPGRDVSGPGGVGAPELEFIFRSLVELKLQVEELRRRLEERPPRVEVIEVGPGSGVSAVTSGVAEAAREADVVYRPGMTMADVERAAIEAALRETQGNRRKAAEVLGIGERTLYRKLKAYALA